MSKEFKVGLTSLIAAGIFYFGYNFLKGADLFSHKTVYYATYDNVNGLNNSNPVILNGFAVGKVSSMALSTGKDKGVTVEMIITENIKLGDSTVAELSNLDVFGGKGIVLKIGPVGEPLRSGDTLISFIDRGLMSYLDDVRPITNDLGVTISRINDLLLDLSGAGVKIISMIEELESTLANVNGMVSENRQGVNEVLSSTVNFLDTLETRIVATDPLINKGQDFFDSLTMAVTNLNSTLEGVDSLTTQTRGLISDAGSREGSLGRLIHDDTLYESLGRLTSELDSLVQHFRRHPKDFLKPLGRRHTKLKGRPQR